MYITMPVNGGTHKTHNTPREVSFQVRICPDITVMVLWVMTAPLHWLIFLCHWHSHSSGNIKKATVSSERIRVIFMSYVIPPRPPPHCSKNCKRLKKFWHLNLEVYPCRHLTFNLRRLCCVILIHNACCCYELLGTFHFPISGISNVWIGGQFLAGPEQY